MGSHWPQEPTTSTPRGTATANGSHSRPKNRGDHRCRAREAVPLLTTKAKSWQQIRTGQGLLIRFNLESGEETDQSVCKISTSLRLRRKAFGRRRFLLQIANSHSIRVECADFSSYSSDHGRPPTLRRRSPAAAAAASAAALRVAAGGLRPSCRCAGAAAARPSST